MFVREFPRWAQSRRAVVVCLAALAGSFFTDVAAAANSAVVIMYHRFGESEHPTTNVRIDQFEAHIETLTTGGYTVLPLPEIVAALKNGKPLPEKTVGISVDDAFLSVYRDGWPRLRDARLPFTLFVATESIDRGIPGYMSWDQIKELADAGVTIGSQTATHPHMPVLSPERMKEELETSNSRFKAKLGKAPDMIAYPYGEYSLAVGKAAREAGFTTGFGQHSGVLHSKADFMYLPRFAFNETFGGVARLKLAARALPLFASDITPADPFLTGKNNPPAFGFTVNEIDPKKLDRLNCYASNGDEIRLERLGERRVEVRLTRAFSPGRSRINCTLHESNGRWRWFGRQFFVPRNSGTN